ncbi:MAG: MFS transporter [Pseudomonadota bacterium]
MHEDDLPAQPTRPDDPEKGGRPDRRGAFRLLFLSLAVIGAGNTMLIAAVLPPLTRELDLPDWMAGAIFSLSAAMWVFASPFWGTRSNTWGRRRVAAMGLAGYSLSMLLFGMFGQLALMGVITAPALIFVSLLFSRSLFGLFGSGTNPAAQAYVADRTSPERRTEEIASVTAGHSFGTVAGPAFAAAIAGLAGLLSPAFLTAIMAAVASYLVWTRLPEDTPPQTTSLRPRPRLISPLWWDRRILPFVLFSVSLSLVTGVIFQTFAFAIMDKLDVEGTVVNQFTGPAYSVGAMATLMAQLVLIPRLNLSNRQLMVVGASCICFGALAIVPTSNFAVLITAQFAIGLGQGLSRPGFFAGASLAVSRSEQGDVAGLMVATNAIGFVVSPLFGPFVYEYVSRDAPFLLAGILLAAMAIYAWVAVEDRTIEAAPDT